MREIKFRIWHNDQILYITPEAELQLNFGMNDGWSLWEPYGEIATHREAELMQYTGLKDRNGKEIYEGDLFKLENHWDTYQVSFKKGSYGIEGVSGSPFISFERISREDYELSEVIGNIYENPELIESTE